MNKDRYFMKIAQAVSEASKCLRAKYGTVIVSEDGRIVSTGYNGKPRGSINDDVCYRLGLEDNASKPNCCLHSEHNAILFCSPEERMGATLYVNGVPCTDCILAIAQSGISRVVYLDDPDALHRGNFDPEFLDEYGFKLEIDCIRVTGEVSLSTILYDLLIQRTINYSMTETARTLLRCSTSPTRWWRMLAGATLEYPIEEARLIGEEFCQEWLEENAKHKVPIIK